MIDENDGIRDTISRLALRTRRLQSMQFVPALLAVLMGAMPAAALEQNTNETGYRECSLERLSACQNTNQLFVGLYGKSGFHSVAKPGFAGALEKFLQGAPRIRFLNHSWSAAKIARERLMGPGNERVHFPSGEWFFDGFTPHDAPEKGVVIFDSAGNILLVATLNFTVNASLPDYVGYHHVLTIFVHSQTTSAKFARYVQDWARRAIAGMFNYPGTPKDVFAGTELLVAENGGRQWEGHWLN
jgi:hypothetical protein